MIVRTCVPRRVRKASKTKVQTSQSQSGQQKPTRPRSQKQSFGAHKETKKNNEMQDTSGEVPRRRENKKIKKGATHVSRPPAAEDCGRPDPQSKGPRPASAAFSCPEPEFLLTACTAPQSTEVRRKSPQPNTCQEHGLRKWSTQVHTRPKRCTNVDERQRKSTSPQEVETKIRRGPKRSTAKLSVLVQSDVQWRRVLTYNDVEVTHNGYGHVLEDGCDEWAWWCHVRSTPTSTDKESTNCNCHPQTESYELPATNHITTPVICNYVRRPFEHNFAATGYNQLHAQGQTSGRRAPRGPGGVPLPSILTPSAQQNRARSAPTDVRLESGIPWHERPEAED